MTVSENGERAAALTLTSALVGGITVIRVTGLLDATTRDQFADYLAAEVEEHGPDMALDLGGVTFMDSRALGLIVHHWQLSTNAGGKFALIGVEYAKTKVMWITGLAQRLPLYDTIEEALAAFG
ncbi:STAS domain-containing protein [Streptosporangium roseum]|uniref:Anti-sigma factor antagonist n=1 Tax=Streptosporangium roseum (strain ATCC 12428 / DSM 43021 / JCM 3005 / KCTC 9067 / NCIMB 10171 / NRRL 2505 / NI 9100) TaxID=479432 RepID=D2BA40_STRRD|nr:STAS domain-containing protein [Streptosporangium roseum]ACZ86053.1 anti-sigma-factor antagonist [Streptosporangium roseum DSM 43021]